MARKNIQPLTLNTESLSRIHQGVPAAAIDAAIRNALLDCADRPNEDKARTVKVEISFVPVPDATRQNCDQVKTQIKVNTTVPKHQTREYLMDVEESRDGRGNPIALAHFVPSEPVMEDEPSTQRSRDDD